MILTSREYKILLAKALSSVTVEEVEELINDEHKLHKQEDAQDRRSRPSNPENHGIKRSPD